LAVAREQVAALLERSLRLGSVAEIVEAFDGRLEVDTHAEARTFGERFEPTGARVNPAIVGRDVRARALAGIHEPLPAQASERGFVDGAALALPTAVLVGGDPQPVEILTNRLLVFATATLSIVIFDAQEHSATGRPRHAPHVERVYHVAEMQVAGRSGSEAGP